LIEQFSINKSNKTKMCLEPAVIRDRPRNDINAVFVDAVPLYILQFIDFYFILCIFAISHLKETHDCSPCHSRISSVLLSDLSEIRPRIFQGER
jgi:hypothetical protein